MVSKSQAIEAEWSNNDDDDDDVNPLFVTCSTILLKEKQNEEKQKEEKQKE